ncbi:hypothetical protein ABN702_16260 [Bacillus haimaensis]|uniref:hypothetical protein n=1 Tax=Bacillus haimaensis TaxID=3160967 RepID=UPI003AA8FE09
MIGLVLSIIIFNLTAFKFNKSLKGNHIAHIWMFTIAFQTCFDVYIDYKLHGYWYFTKAVEWWELPATTILVPPVNIIFLNFYPFNNSLSKQIKYIIYWVIGILAYEMLTLLPEPIGYFNYGWWTIWHSVIIDPILFVILLTYYKWILKLERKSTDISEEKK